MKFCNKCGKMLEEHSNTCQYCGHVEMGAAPSPDVFPAHTMPMSEPGVSNAVKVTLSALTCLVSGVGPIIGLIMGLIYMGKDNLDTKSFGKALMILSVVLLSISIICCIIWVVFYASIFASFQDIVW